MMKRCIPVILIFCFAIIHVQAQYSLWSWGSGEDAALGDGYYSGGPVIHYATDPEPRACYDDWIAVVTGKAMTYGLRQDGTLWGWGTSAFMGIPNSQMEYPAPKNLQAHPVQIGIDHDWSQVATTGTITLALKTNGSLWGWGDNRAGTLGDGTFTDRVSPTRIGVDTDWKQIGVYKTTALGIKTNGTLWSWGSSALLGDGTTADRNVPRQVGTVTNWQTLATGNHQCTHTGAIRTDGTLWMWGENTDSQLGFVGSAQTVPRRIGTATNWKQIALGGESFTLAIRTDATLWTWGQNSQGQLGNGSTNDYSAHQVGGAEWAHVSAGNMFSIGVKTDGSLWRWGYVTYQGSYGSTPLRVGTSSLWKTTAAGDDFAIALQDSPFDPVAGDPVLELGSDITTCQSFANIAVNVPNAATYRTYRWVHPDGWSNAVNDATYRFTASGTYTLTVTTSGCSQTDAINVTVGSSALLDFNYSGTPIPYCNTSFYMEDDMTFTNATYLPDNPGAQYTWDFGDGTSSHDVSTTHKYTQEGQYTVSLSSSRHCSPVTKTITVAPKLSIGNDIQTCQSPVTLTANMDSPGCFWQVPPANQVISNQKSISATRSGTYSFSVRVGGCGQLATINVTILSTTVPTFTQTGTALAGCSGVYDVTQPVSFTNTTQNASQYQFSWDLGDGHTMTTVPENYRYAQPGRYQVRLTNTSCPGNPGTRYITVLPKLELGEDRVACGPTTVAANFEGADVYYWETPAGAADGPSSVDADVNGIYKLTTLQFSCVQTDQVAIAVHTAVPPDFTMTAAGSAIESGGIVLLDMPVSFTGQGGDGSRYAWALGDGATADAATLEHEYADPGTYTIQLTTTDEWGCTAAISKTLQVSRLIVTDAISPNGDGKNDHLVVTPLLYEATLKVIDRAGRTVYEASPYNNDFSGQNLESDVYYYELTFKDTGKNQKGYVHIIR